MCLPFDNKKPNTFQGKRSVFQLQLIAFIQLALLFARQVAQFELGELFEIFFIILLWSAWSSLGSCQCLFYIVITLYYILLKGLYFATRFQNELPLLGETGREKILAVLHLATLFFYIIAQYIVFLAYKEFVALEMEKDYTVEEPERRPLQQNERTQQPIVVKNSAFTGKGITIG
ncbi:unnamed protein product (macronuclear) [Paramecium tetraurelia]|uniref:Uncharacterized protein n=1 Tax=Paramecium tetraurelia TaxID=5888 RepID=A0D6S6_PARTE|nr:uncharacterized protein GSPATT00001784001 [Paramecium tetraurelia]CAK78743.1 unnamed protein product [Paramecium tetraurelia]|eukprot:XP_001446140.1 hypothetical protein (macronuclear) [Paramecium tetraurelia strain d4-2]